MAGAFSLRESQAVQGRRILLVDYVFTIGSTLRECANVLKEGRAAEIFAFAVARAVQDKSAA